MKPSNWIKGGAVGVRHAVGMALSVATISLLCSVPVAAQDGGMRVVKDAQTGQLRAPTADEFKAMQAQENAARSAKKKNLGILSHSEEPKMVRHKRGGLKMELTEDTMVFSVVTRNADGSLAMQCVTGADAAQKAVNQPAASTSTVHLDEGHNHDIK